MRGDVWKYLGRSRSRELKCSVEEVHVDTHRLVFEAALARSGADAERDERGAWMYE